MGSERESDKFYIELIGLKKTRSFTVDKTLSEQFFGVPEDIKVVRYSNEHADIEVFIDEKRDSNVRNPFTHLCFTVENRDIFVKKAKKLGYKVTQVSREPEGYYLFIEDGFNLYEIK